MWMHQKKRLYHEAPPLHVYLRVLSPLRWGKLDAKGTWIHFCCCWNETEVSNSNWARKCNYNCFALTKGMDLTCNNQIREIVTLTPMLYSPVVDFPSFVLCLNVCPSTTSSHPGIPLLAYLSLLVFDRLHILHISVSFLFPSDQHSQVESHRCCYLDLFNEQI